MDYDKVLAEIEKYESDPNPTLMTFGMLCTLRLPTIKAALIDAQKLAQANENLRMAREALKDYVACVNADKAMKFYHGDNLSQKHAAALAQIGDKP